jgi:hypothetical protein
LPSLATSARLRTTLIPAAREKKRRYYGSFLATRLVRRGAEALPNQITSPVTPACDLLPKELDGGNGTEGTARMMRRRLPRLEHRGPHPSGVAWGERGNRRWALDAPPDPRLTFENISRGRVRGLRSREGRVCQRPCEAVWRCVLGILLAPPATSFTAAEGGLPKTLATSLPPLVPQAGPLQAPETPGEQAWPRAPHHAPHGDQPAFCTSLLHG